MTMFVRVWWRGTAAALVHVQDVPIMHVAAEGYAASAVTDTEFTGAAAHAQDVRAALAGGPDAPHVEGREVLRHGTAGMVWGGGPVDAPAWEAEE